MASIESEEQNTVKYDHVIRKWEKGNKKDKKRGKGNVGCGWTKKKKCIIVPTDIVRSLCVRLEA